MKRVFVLSQQSLFGKGIESLLSKESNITLVGKDINHNAAAECIQQMQPDVVIIDCDDSDLDLSPAILCVLRKRPETTIIGLSLENNNISVHRGEEKQIFQVTDLMDIIHTI